MSANSSTDPFGLVGMLLDGKHRVDRMVAMGGFGVVYAGHHLRLDAPIAIKVMKPLVATPEQQSLALVSFIDEARTTARLRHPHIAQVLDAGIAESARVPGGIAWMVLEWLEGESLRDELQRRRGRGGRSPRECWRLLRPVLEAVAYAHEAGVVHRDLKPNNVMLAKAGTGVVVKVLDFGIAKVLHGPEAPTSGNTTTRADHSAFSPGYAAPEQMSQTRTGPWTDVHTLGLLLSEVLTDSAPYPTHDANELLAMVFDPQRPTPLRSGVDVGEWERVIARALAIKPAERHANARELFDALAAALDGAESQRAVLPLAELALAAPAPPTTPDPTSTGQDAPPSSATLPASAVTAYLPRRRRTVTLGLGGVILALAGAWAVNSLRTGAKPQIVATESQAREHWVQADLAASQALAGAGEDVPVTPSIVAAHLMGSDPTRAAAASRKLAVKQRPDLAQTLLCLADALDAKQGDRDARARLETASRAERSPAACRLVLADLDTGPERMRWVSGLPKNSDRVHLDDWVDADRWTEALLAFEADPSQEPPRPQFYPMDQLISPHLLLIRRPLGLELGLRWSNPEGLLLRALFESYLGDHAAAAQALREALHAAGVRAYGGGSQPGNLFEYRIAGSRAQRLPFRHFFFLGAVLATRAGEAKNARIYVDLAPEETHGRRSLLPFLDALERGGTPHSGVVEYDPRGPDVALWKGVSSGRPPVIRARLEKHRSRGLAVLPFAPREAVQNDTLRDWAENQLDPPCWGCTPQQAFRDVVELRRLAATVGSETLETDLGARVERVRTALTRRDIAIPLYLLARFEP